MTKITKGLLAALLAGVGLLFSGPQAGMSQQGLQEFIDLDHDCGAGCAPNAPVCCYASPPIIIIIE